MSWQCLNCGKALEFKDVTYRETHDPKAGGCGGPAIWDDHGKIAVEKGLSCE